MLSRIYIKDIHGWKIKKKYKLQSKLLVSITWLLANGENGSMFEYSI